VQQPGSCAGEGGPGHFQRAKNACFVIVESLKTVGSRGQRTASVSTSESSESEAAVGNDRMRGHERSRRQIETAGRLGETVCLQAELTSAARIEVYCSSPGRGRVQYYGRREGKTKLRRGETTGPLACAGIGRVSASVFFWAMKWSREGGSCFATLGWRR